MDFKSAAYLKTAFKLFIHDNQSQPEIAANCVYEALAEALEFTFPWNGDAILWRRKFLKKWIQIDEENAE